MRPIVSALPPLAGPLRGGWPPCGERLLASPSPPPPPPPRARPTLRRCPADVCERLCKDPRRLVGAERAVCGPRGMRRGGGGEVLNRVTSHPSGSRFARLRLLSWPAAGCGHGGSARRSLPTRGRGVPRRLCRRSRGRCASGCAHPSNAAPSRGPSSWTTRSGLEGGGLGAKLGSQPYSCGASDRASSSAAPPGMPPPTGAEQGKPRGTAELRKVLEAPFGP